MVSTHSCPQFWRSKKNPNSTRFIKLYSGVLEQIKLYNPLVRRHRVQVRAPAGHLTITPEGYSRRHSRQSKVSTAKSMVKLLGPRSGTAQGLGRVGRASTKKGVSDSAAVAMGHDRPRARLIKTCFHSCDTDSSFNTM